MAIKRTKEQKQRARAIQFSYSAKKQTQLVAHTQQRSAENTEYITKDLFRTIIVSFFLFGILVGIYLYLRYN